MARSPRVVLGVCGGIAAYKSAEVARGLVPRRRGGPGRDDPRRRRVRRTPDVRGPLGSRGPHGSLGAARTRRRWITSRSPTGPTSSSSRRPRRTRLAKFAHGLADDFLSTYFLAHHGPVLLAPAMETRMWEHPAVRQNVGCSAPPRGAPRRPGNRTARLGTRGRRSDGGARGRSSSRPSALRRAGRGPRRTETPRDGRSDARAHRSDPIRVEPVERAAWASPWPRRPATAAPASPCSPGRRSCRARRACASSRFETLGRPPRASARGVSGVRRPRHGRGGRRLHSREERRTAPPGRAARPPCASIRGAICSRASGLCAADRPSSRSPPRRKTSKSGAGERWSRKGRTSSSSTTSAVRTSGFESEQNEVLLLENGGGREPVARADKREIADRIWDAFLRVRTSSRTSGADVTAPSGQTAPNRS